MTGGSGLRSITMNRVVLSPSALMPAQRICKPYRPAVSALAMAATVGSFSSATWRAASAVLPHVPVFKAVLLHENAALGQRLRMADDRADGLQRCTGTASRSCRMGKSHAGR